MRVSFATIEFLAELGDSDAVRAKNTWLDLSSVNEPPASVVGYLCNDTILIALIWDRKYEAMLARRKQTYKTDFLRNALVNLVQLGQDRFR